MSELILHHYPPSPLSEKIRVALGLKGLSWKSVEIPRVPPKPDVMPLTGGYRRTPIMQIGADIFCDSQMILIELERRYPSSHVSLLKIINTNAWTDSLVTKLIGVAIAESSDQFPQEWLNDRIQLFFGGDFDLEEAKIRIPHLFAQVQLHFQWANEEIKKNGGFLSGSSPSSCDASFFYLPWFIRRRWKHGEAFLSRFPLVLDWEKRIAEIGHGESSSLSAQDALDVARESKSDTNTHVDPTDPQNIQLGDKVSVVFDENSGEAPVTGTVRYLDSYQIGIDREDDRVGAVCVHFPRLGYLITKHVG